MTRKETGYRNTVSQQRHGNTVLSDAKWMYYMFGVLHFNNDIEHF